MKRKIEILILSDLHLGSFGCRARELNRYLRSVNPEMVILNGDIIDMWQFKKRYWPDHHMRVIKQLIKMASKVPVYYITGNHDEALRKYSNFHLGNLQLVDKLEITVDGERYWIFHGDIFDMAMKNARWLAKLGAIGYDTLIWANTVVNWALESTGRERMSFSKRIKNSVKKAVSYISDFEETAASIAIENHYDYVVCGHIHQPAMKTISTKRGSVKYLNSGDWIENLTALEYKSGKWSMYNYDARHYQEQEMKEKLHVYLNRKSA